MAFTVIEAAEKSGIGSHAIRFYDRQGLLPFLKRKPNGIRDFSDLDMECLEIIKTLKATGMKIEQIKAYFDLCVQGNSALEQRLQFMQNHKKELKRQADELKKHMEVVNYKLWYYETAIEEGNEEIHDNHYFETGEGSWQRYKRIKNNPKGL